MPWNINNKLLPIVGVLTLLGLFFVLFNSCSRGDKSPTRLSQVPTSPAPDADSPADTIKTLTANVGELISDVDALRKDNANLYKARDDLETEFSNRIASELAEYHKSQSVFGNRSANEVVQLQDQVDALTKQIQDLTQQTLEGSDVPFGFGLDGLAQEASGAISTAYVWIDPLDSSIEPHEFGDSSSSTNRRPLFTIPRNATLIGSTVMTALVGRVPVQGQLRDPMPFKVLTGFENLAANGFKISGIQGMVWSGYAVGDWTLGCVSGRLDSVTFVFEDGTLHTISSGREGGSSQTALGWISDEYGVPCILGQRKSNAASFLYQQATLNATRAAADAAAATEITQSFGALGGVQSLVTGETGKYVLDKAISGGAQASADWLAQRASQEIDAIYVAAGQEVALHIDRELQIDYDRGGRKLRHDEPSNSPVVLDLD